MSLSTIQTKTVGVKKQVTSCMGTVDNIRDLDLSKSFITGQVCHSCDVLCNYYLGGGSMSCRDSRTGETFLHVLTDYVHLYLSANCTRIVYMLSTKIDLDVPDHNGDTVLHKTVRVTGAWRFIVALMRCGANPLIKNKAGRTPEEEILHLKNPGWEENLHWLRKYHPGLWAAVKAKNPDPVLIERLLRYWCRTVKIVGNQTENLKLDLVCILEKYENTNEMALAMLSGKSKFINMWKNAENLQKIDVNTKDHSYQFYYRDPGVSCRPVGVRMKNLKLTKSSCFFSPQLVNPKSRPHNEAITKHILRYCDLNIRNVQGQTLLVEAMYNGETEGVIRVILNAGINIGARDAMGRTARDHCDILKREDYKQLIDSHVIELIQECDLERLEALVLQMYDHVIPPSNKLRIMSLVRQKSSKQLTELLKYIDCKQAFIRKLFLLVKNGDKAELVKQMSRKYVNARDKAGRTLLHYAIQYSYDHICESLHSSAGPTLYTSDRNSINSNGQIILQDISLTPEDDRDMTRLVSGNRRMRCIITDLKKDCKKRHCFRRFFTDSNCTPDYFGIIRYLVQEYPSMLGVTNNIGQTPLHYAHIFSASKAVIDLLERNGACANVKDVGCITSNSYTTLTCSQ
ncbi:unnamed protein product [Candidula unifasciata]|uniref:Uncharacterized protein n=1 Tax=Candidula unifasciata TaxID=100452 RepID=A0A8S3YKX8_9EUPU|nr:unnamed protein product [Candidula unifasciata]